MFSKQLTDELHATVQENANQQEVIKRLRKEKKEVEEALESLEQKQRTTVKDKYAAEDAKEEAERRLA